MSDDIVKELRKSKWNENPSTNAMLCEEAADEIERLRKIIRDFYFEEEKYQHSMNQDSVTEYIIPQSWKDAYTAFEKEARRIEFGDE